MNMTRGTARGTTSPLASLLLVGVTIAMAAMVSVSFTAFTAVDQPALAGFEVSHGGDGVYVTMTTVQTEGRYRVLVDGQHVYTFTDEDVGETVHVVGVAAGDPIVVVGTNGETTQLLLSTEARRAYDPDEPPAVNPDPVVAPVVTYRDSAGYRQQRTASGELSLLHTGTPLYPGLSGSTTATIDNGGDTGRTLSLSLTEIRSDENGIVEPEADAGDGTTGTGNGEWERWTMVRIYVVTDGNRRYLVGDGATWTPLSALGEGAVGQVTVPAGESVRVVVEWRLSTAADNTAQSDTLVFRGLFEFTGD